MTKVKFEKMSDGCSGERFPNRCPHEGKFDSYSMACKECADDAIKALNEAFDDHVGAAARNLKKDI